MPATKQATDKRCKKGWTLKDQMNELRGKYHLKKKDSDAYREGSKLEIKLNDHIIRNQRQDNKVKRITLAEHENGDERVIKTVFKDDRKQRLSLQRYTASGAIEEMDQKVCEGGKVLSASRYEGAAGEKKLEDLDITLDMMIHVEQPSPELKELGQSVTIMLENSLDKALIKYDTARNISRRYQEILQTLKDESLTLPAKLDAMEQSLLQQKAELKELKAMAKDAYLSRDETKKELAIIEQQTYESRRKRDTELTATRKEVERRKEQAEKVEKRPNRTYINTENQDLKILQEEQMRKDNQQKILTYEGAYLAIKEATFVTDVNDVIERVLTQRQTQEGLLNQVQDCEATRNRLLDEKNKLVQQYHDLKYTGDQKLSKGQRLLDEMQEHLEKEEANRKRTQDRLERAGNMLINIKVGTTTLLEKLQNVKLSPPQTNFPKDDVFDQLDVCREKLQRLMHQISKMSANAQLKEKLQAAEFHEYLESQLPPDNVRIKLASSDPHMADFDFNSQELDEMMSRADIKLMGQKLIDSKVRTKKRKAKKK